MRSGKTPPFVRPDKRAFAMQDWRIVNGRSLQDGALIPEWDQSLNLTLTRVVEINLQMVVETGRLRPGTRLALLSTWWSEGTGLRGCGEQTSLTIASQSARPQRFELFLAAPGHVLAGNLQLRSALVLLEQTSDMVADVLAPHRPGSILWEDAITVVLEGQASRFPITVMDFVESDLGPENSCWHFDWSPAEPSLPAMATMRLYFNSRHPTFHAAMVSRDLSPSQSVMRSALKFGLGEELIRLALERADELEAGETEFAAGSSGRVLLELLERVFPGRGPIACREFRLQDPGRFVAEIQARTGLFVNSPSDGEAQ